MPGFNISKPFSKEADATDHNMGRFTIKAAVLLLTRFEEVRGLAAARQDGCACRLVLANSAAPPCWL